MWLLVALVVVGGAREVVSQCWEHPSCQELSSESNMMVNAQTHCSLRPDIMGGSSFFLPRSSRFLLFLSCRSASSSVTLTSPPRPLSSPATPTSSPLSHQTPPHFLLRPSAPTQWSTSAGGSPLAENAAPSKCTPPTAWRRSLLKFSPKR